MFPYPNVARLITSLVCVCRAVALRRPALGRGSSPRSPWSVTAGQTTWPSTCPLRDTGPLTPLLPRLPASRTRLIFCTTANRSVPLNGEYLLSIQESMSLSYTVFVVLRCRVFKCLKLPRCYYFLSMSIVFIKCTQMS